MAARINALTVESFHGEQLNQTMDQQSLVNVRMDTVGLLRGASLHGKVFTNISGVVNEQSKRVAQGTNL